MTQLRLLLEELCSDLCRFEHVVKDGLGPDSVTIKREHYLDTPGAFADILVAPAGKPPYALEVKYGYPDDMLLRHMKRKYSVQRPPLSGVQKVILVVDSEDRPDWLRLEAEISASLYPGLVLETWNQNRLLNMLQERFHVDVSAITTDGLLDVRQAIDRAKGFHAFGGASLAEYEHDPLKAELLWYFGFWKLRQMRELKRLGPRDILPPGLYRGVAVLLADLCSFSSYVRDTPDSGIIRDNLTAFYSRARYQIINDGGMLYRFVGDEAIGLFGIPDPVSTFAQDALDSAQSLLSIGNSISHHWQRQIDRVQTAGGLHIGLAIGDLQIVSLRPFSRTHVGSIGDCINVAARLMASAGPNEIVVSNSFHQALDEVTQARFQEIEPVEARNVGRIKAWKLSAPQSFRPGDRAA